MITMLLGSLGFTNALNTVVFAWLLAAQGAVSQAATVLHRAPSGKLAALGPCSSPGAGKPSAPVASGCKFYRNLPGSQVGCEGTDWV